jgi:hypothetical protein
MTYPFPRVCSVEKCRACDILEDCQECLQRQSAYCMWLSTQPLGRPLRGELEQLAFDLMQAAQEMRDTGGVGETGALPSMWEQYMQRRKA